MVECIKIVILIDIFFVYLLVVMKIKKKILLL